MMELNTLHETILHDIILNQRLISRIGSWFDRTAANRATRYNRRWEALNMRVIAQARQVSDRNGP
jgi:hypothetical protein